MEISSVSIKTWRTVHSKGSKLKLSIEMIAPKTSCVFILVVCQLVFLNNPCYSQFHWGKNYDMEADHLRTLLQNYVADQEQRSMESIPKVIIFCVLS